MHERETDDDDWDDAEDDVDEPPDDDDEDTVPCPHCGKAIFESSERCAYCENYITKEDAGPSTKPWWMIFGLGVCLLAAAFWVLR